MAASPSSPAMKGVYYPSWAQHFNPSSIDPKLFTHVYYAFINPNKNTFEFDIDDEKVRVIENFRSSLNPQLVTLFSVGGDAAGTEFFSNMAASPASRAAFIRSSIQVARKFKFDGIDLDWEFPQTPTDMENLGHLLDEWRAEVRNEAAAATGRQELLLSAAVYYSVNFQWGEARAYPVPSLTGNLDWINIMNYDYHGKWEPTATGAHSALSDPDPQSNLSTRYGLNSWIQAELPRSKMIMGLPLYGKTWKLQDPRVHGIGAPAEGVGPGWEGSGILTYAEIVNFNEENNANVVYDLDITASVYSVAGDIWVGYDDPETIAVKVEYARELGLRGYFFWQVTGDYNWSISQSASQAWSPPR